MAKSGLAATPEPPYYAVVFTSRRTNKDPDGYGAMADAMEDLASKQPGYHGIESAHGPDDVHITVSYWATLEAIAAWKAVAEHAAAQRLGRERWYEAYELRVCRVERAYGFHR
jgi:heme-degrading monooxygenase HmoA